MTNYKLYLEAIGEPTEGLDEMLKDINEKAAYIEYLKNLKSDAFVAYNSFDRINDKVLKEHHQERYTNLKLALESIYLFA